MVKIRLTRTGKTHSASYRIVIADQRSPRDGRFIEEIGHYNPNSKELAVNADAAKKWLGRLPGGLAIGTVAGCAGFSAVCGDSMATVITMTTVALPSMDEAGYNVTLSCGALAAGGTLGILIPPSMGFIIYSMITEESVGKLFISGIIPGILLATIFSLIIAIRVKQHPEWAPKSPAYPLKEKLLYARVMIEDEQGGKAWSQPIFIDELLDEPEFAMDSTVVK